MALVTARNSKPLPAKQGCSRHGARQHLVCCCNADCSKVATSLGPLPHARLHIDQSPLTAVAPIAAVALDRPKKQRTRWLKAECQADGCDYLVRVSARNVRDVGPPPCPKHGPMQVELPPEDDEPEMIVGNRFERAHALTLKLRR